MIDDNVENVSLRKFIKSMSFNNGGVFNTALNTYYFMQTQCLHGNIKYVVGKLYLAEQSVETEFCTTVRADLKDKIGTGYNSFIERLTFLRDVHNTCQELFKRMKLYELTTDTE